MKLFHIFKFFVLTLLFTTSCAPQPTDRLHPNSETAKRLIAMEGSLRTKGGYNSYLALEYLSFARSLFAIGDKTNSDRFMQKGVRIANGENFIPENPLIWKADPAQVEEMLLMQKRLEIVLDEPQMTFYLPIQTAHLSYLYDCWISRESKAVFRADELAGCRTKFSKLLDEIENYIDDLHKDKEPITAITEVEFESFRILFDFGFHKFSDQANKDLLGVLKYLKTLNGHYKIMVVGNADRVGFEIANQHLALNRAEVVANYLVKNGVPQELVEIRSFGEDYPDIITKDGVQDQYNRSVGIYVLKNMRDFKSLPLPLIQNEIYRRDIEKERAMRGLE